MAYVQPNSRIEFFTDLGLSQDYNDTLYFPSVSAKDAYFANIDRLAHVDKCYYAREHRGFVRVELPMVTLIHAQYMRFKNTSYENKWWYAFVDDVNYVNDNTTEVKFTIDPMMTWMGEFEITDCYIERQHGATDVVGDNIIDEPVNIGTYVTNDITRTGHFKNWSYIVFFSPNVLGQFTESDINDDLGIYSGLSAIIFPDDGTAATKLDIYRVVEVIFGSVQMVAYVPDDFVPYLPNVQGYNDPQTRQTAPVIHTHSIARSTTVNNIDGYTPRNKKLYTAPYNMLCVINTEGEENTYRYEFFADNQTHTIDFQIASSINERSQIRLAPYDYKGQSVNQEEIMTMNDFPYATWASDAFMAYMAQSLSDSPVRLMASGSNRKDNSDSNTTSSSEYDRSRILSNGRVVRTTGGLAEGIKGVAEGVASASNLAVSQSIQIGANIGKAFLTPNSVKGGSAADVTTLLGKGSYAGSYKDFWFFRKSINRQNAEIIDNYFTMFGYAQKKVGKPNMNARTRFTYVKTVQSKINCMCPASDADFIEECLNRGIRFWKDHTQIGNYHDDNLPLN